MCTLTACHFRELLLVELSGAFVLFAESFISTAGRVQEKEERDPTDDSLIS